MSEKVVIITGASSGFGKLMSLTYAKKGAKVVVADTNITEGNSVVDEIKKNGGDAIFVKTDVSKAQDSDNLVKETVKAYGRLDIAINNAGISGGSAPIGEYPIDTWDKIIGIDLSGVFYGMHYQIPQMLKNGGGSIVNMSSILGQVGFVNACGYVAAKHGVVGLSQNAGLEYAKKGIRVNAVGPGFVDTNLTHELTKDKSEDDFLISRHPMGRLGERQEVVNLVLWLNSDEASFCTGGYYPVDGGYLAQ